MSTKKIFGYLAFLPCLLSSACFVQGFQGGDSQASGCPVGSAGCFCAPGGACEGSLVCLSDRCVDLNSSTHSVPGAGSSSLNPSTSASVQDSGPHSGVASTASLPGSQSSSASSTQPQTSCEDGQKNALESDVDCGGPDCPACAAGLACVRASDCASQHCVNQRCVPEDYECSRDQDCEDNQPCTSNRCNAQGRCETELLPDASPCNDADACTSADQCKKGLCVGQDTRVLEETFSKAPFVFLNHPRTELNHWEIAPAKASSCAPKGFVEDPAQDHTQDGSNGLMGVEVGGCQATPQDNLEDCAWSDWVDVSHFDGDVLFSYWRHLSSPGRDPVNQTLPMVTNSIYYRVPGETASYLIESGWNKAVNDEGWVQIQHRVPSTDLKKVSFGICYKRLGSQGGFPGWSVDDVFVRQFGCENGR